MTLTETAIAVADAILACVEIEKAYEEIAGQSTTNREGRDIRRQAKEAADKFYVLVEAYATMKKEAKP